MRKTAGRALAAALALAALLRAALLLRRYADTDELEHLHAALLVRHGAWPYRDFFEHHGPALWLLAAPLARAARGPYAYLVAGRVLMAAASAAIVWIVFRLRPERGSLERSLSAALLAFFGLFAWKTLEFRPDVPALLALAGALAAAVSGRSRAGLWCGLCVGVGLWFTPKIGLPAACLVAASARRRTASAGSREGRSFLAETAAGALAPLAVGAACFAAAGAWGPLWDCLVRFNLGFRRVGGAWSVLGASLAADPAFWALGLCGLASWRDRPEEAGLLAGALAGFFLVPIAQPQSLLPAAPALAVLGAAAWTRFFDAPARRPAVLACASVALVFLAFARPTAAALRREDLALQRERWDCASRLTGPDERVLDVWSGDAFHRPNADWLWFLPDENQAQFEPGRLERRYAAALADPRTRGLIWCESCFARMPSSFVETARRLYRPSGCGRLWLRKDGA